MLKAVLAATDGSGHSEKAVGSAVDIASKYHAKLVVLSVIQPGPLPRTVHEKLKAEKRRDSGGPTHPLIANVPSWMDKAVEAIKESTGEGHALQEAVAREALEDARLRAETQGIQDLELITEHGDPAQFILDISERESVDLIVLGRRGLGGVKGIMLGSVSTKIVQAADCPCMVAG